MLSLIALALMAAPLEEWDRAGEAELKKPAAPVAMAVDGFYWIDAEDFDEYGGWELDTQYVYLIGSGYLIAPGVGEPVADAVLSFAVVSPGRYRVWVRARDWLPEYHPGRFQVLVNGETLDSVLGEADHDEWAWVLAGEAPLHAGGNTLALHDLSGSFARCDALVLTTDPDYVPPPDMKDIEKERARLTGRSLEARHKGDFDVVVVGGGPAGCPAAIAASRMGARTALIQDRPVLGGNASLELGVGLAGAAGFIPCARETGIVEEASRMQAFESFRRVTIPFHRLAEAEQNLTLFLNTRAVDADMDPSSAITTVKAMDTLTGAYSTFGARYVIDCTGDGWVGYYAGAEYRVGREPRGMYDEPDAPETPDGITMSGCIMGRHGVGFDAELAGKPVEYVAPAWAADIPDLVEHGRRPRNLLSGEWWMEHAGTWDDLFDAERSRDELIRISFAYWDYLKNRWPERERLAKYELTYVPYLVAKRETRRLIGDHVLTTDEVLAGTMFPDRIAYGGWPVDIHNPHGIYKGDTPYHTNYRVKEMYTVPFRCLYSKNVPNLLFAGRCASFSHFALGTVRVERTLANLGQAAGTAAALCARKNITPRALHDAHIGELQQALLKFDQYIPQVANEDPADLARQATVTASSVAEGFEFPRSRVALRPDAHALDHRRGMMLPVQAGRIDRACVYVKSLRQTPVTLRAHLREADHCDDFSRTDDLALAEAALPPGKQQWLPFDFGVATDSPCAWLWLEPAEDVEWRLMQSGLPGMTRAYAGKGADGPDAWVRPGGVYACYLDPPAMTRNLCSPANVINGVARIVGEESNMWRSDSAHALPQWVELRFPKPVTFNTVHLTFSTDINTRYLTHSDKPDAIVDYVLSAPSDGRRRILAAEKGCYQRWRRVTFAPVATSVLRLELTAAEGTEAGGVYEIRVYNE